MYMNNPAAVLEELEKGLKYILKYDNDYQGEAISRTMPIDQKEYLFSTFPPFFDGLLPEGTMLEGLIRGKKIDRNDLFSQLCAVGNDLVGAITVAEMTVAEMTG